MIVVDKAVIDRLRTDPNINVHENLVLPQKDPAGPVVVEVDMPYINYASAVGADDNPRLSARRLRVSVPFYLTYVGLSQAQAKVLGEAARDLLARWCPTIPGYVTCPVYLEESQRVRRDDDAVNPEGKPLFVGVDAYAVSIRPATLLAS